MQYAWALGFGGCFCMEGVMWFNSFCGRLLSECGGRIVKCDSVGGRNSV